MAADPQPEDAQSDDLFGRWLAHHEQQSNDGETTGSVQGTTDPTTDPTADQATGQATGQASPPRASRRLPAAAVASSAVERDPLIGNRLAPPSNFGVRRSAGTTAEGSPEPPSGWEPIVMASARKKAEKAETRPTGPEPAGRLHRLKSRFVDPKESTPEPDAAAPGQQLTPPAADRAPLPVRTPAPLASRSIEDSLPAAAPEPQVARHTNPPVAQPPVEPAVRSQEPQEPPPARPVRAFIDTAPVVEQHEPQPVEDRPRPKHAAIVEPSSGLEPLTDLDLVVDESVVAEAEPELTVDPVVEPVLEPLVDPRVITKAAPVAAVEPEPASQVEPGPIAVATAPEPVVTTGADAPPAPLPGRGSFLTRAPREPRKPKAGRRAARATSGNAARDLVAAKALARAAEPAATPPTPDEAGAVVVEAPPEPEVAPASGKASKHEQVATQMPGVYAFEPRKTSRRLLTIALLIGLVFSAYFGKAAVDTQDTASMGLAAIVLMATAMVWAIRAGAAPTKLEVHQGQLEVVRQGDRYVFDLASTYTRIEVRGRPGRRGWKVLFPRRGMAPFAVDATMVDPDDFMRVLRFFRPELVPH
jgi:hypothetical protein